MSARALLFSSIVSLVGLAAVACTSGTTPNCASDGGCGALPSEGGVAETGPDSPATDAPASDGSSASDARASGPDAGAAIDAAPADAHAGG